MKKHASAVVGVMVVSVILTGCGGGTTKKSADPSQFATTAPTQAQVVGAFGVPLTLADGSKYELSAPAAFTPGQFASGQIPGQVNEGFDLKITNGSKAPLDLSTLIVQGSTGSGACADIFDGDHNVNGAPQTPLSAGASIAFKWALTCPGKVGDKLDVVFSVANVNIIQASGKLA